MHCVKKKDLKDNKLSSLHLAQKYAWIFIRGHFTVTIPQSSHLSSNYALRVRFLEQIMPMDKYPSIIFTPIEGYCLFTGKLNTD